MATFKIQDILEIQKKIQSKIINPETEEATKQWLIMPLIVALGYNPFSTDIIPEFTLDVGTKKGEKVDYALQINNQPVAIVECKQLNVTLSEKHISQLYRYFTISNVHIAILTNGDDYWFFTDSNKENIMDLKPYYKLKLSEATSDEISKLEIYSKDIIQYADVNQVVRYERFQDECKTMVQGLRTNTIPTWLLDSLAERSGLYDVEKPILAEYLYNEVQQQFDGFKPDKSRPRNTQRKSDTKSKMNSLGERMKETMQKNKENKSNIKLDHLYVYNDYSDGDWKFHTLDYAIILGVRYDNITARSLLVNTVIELFKQKKINREDILSDERFNGQYKISVAGGFRGAFYLDDYDVNISTSYGIEQIVKFIQRLLEYAKLPDNSICVSFKD